MCRCIIAWQVRSWRVSSLFCIKHAFDRQLPDFGTVATSEVNGVLWLRGISEVDSLNHEIRKHRNERHEW